MTEKFDDILNYDPLLEAERATGLSYKEDPGTSALGFLLHQEHNERLRDELMLRQDTYWGMPYEDAVDVVLSQGFTPVWAWQGIGRYGNPSKAAAFWSDGILVVMNGSERAVGHIHMEFNWRPADDSEEERPFSPFFRLPISGGMQHRSEGFDDVDGDPWTGVASVYGDEGFIHRLAQLRASGKLLKEWYITDDLLSIYSVAPDERIDRDHAEKNKWEDIKDVIRERVGQFDEPARSAVQAGMFGKDWE